MENDPQTVGLCLFDSNGVTLATMIDQLDGVRHTSAPHELSIIPLFGAKEPLEPPAFLLEIRGGNSRAVAVDHIRDILQLPIEKLFLLPQLWSKSFQISCVWALFLIDDLAVPVIDFQRLVLI